MSEQHIVETTALGKRYGSLWALRECSVGIPAGSVAALVGPNGAGKTTLLHMLIGLSEPSTGEASVFGWSPREHPQLVLPRVGFVAQEHPLYRGFKLAEMLKLGGKLNPRWDDDLARRRLARLGLPLEQKVGKLSGGQQAQVALTMALAKRPELLFLDEPVAALDPLARREFLQGLMEAVVEDGLTVVLSSHIVAELERVCDFLVILAAGGVQLAGGIEEILASHRLLTEAADRPWTDRPRALRDPGEPQRAPDHAPRADERPSRRFFVADRRGRSRGDRVRLPRSAVGRHHARAA
jgi:ABC-2 type transport system ATP-binding protein